MILVDGKIATGDAIGFSQAIALKDGLVQDTGSTEEILRLRGEQTRVIPLEGRTVIPGLNDSHAHVVRGGRFYNLELRWDGVRSLEKALAMVREQAARTPDGQWVRVIGGFSPYQFEERRMPTIAELNEAAPETPVFVLFLYSKGFLNRAGKEALGVEVELQDFDLALFEGNSSRQGLKIYNPPEFESPYFLYLNQARTEFSLASLFDNRLVLPRLELQGAVLNLESNGLSTNYGKIIDYLEKTKKAEEGEKTENSTAKPQEKGKEFIIHEIIIQDVVVRGSVGVWGSPQIGTTLKISEIRLEDIGSASDGGVPLTKLMRIVILAILEKAAEQGREILPSSIVKKLAGGLEEIEKLGIAGIKFIGNQAVKGVSEVTGQVGNVIEGIGGLLGGGSEEEEGEKKPPEKDSTSEKP